MSDDVLCRENLTDLVYFLRHHKAPQDAPELCDWTCACNGRLDKIVAHDAALRERVAELDILRKNISAHVNAVIAGHITEAHAVGEIAAELDDYDARQALEADNAD